MLTLTKTEAIAEVVDAMFNVPRIDPSFSAYAKVMLERLERFGLVFARGADAPCPCCGKPATTSHCVMGGCPLGADL